MTTKQGKHTTVPYHTAQVCAHTCDYHKAALIAAAPDLLAACQEVRELIDGYVDIKDGDYENGPLPNNAMRAVQILDAAIAKAEGKVTS